MTMFVESKQLETMPRFKKIFLYILAVYFTDFELVSGKKDSPSVIIIGAGASGIARDGSRGWSWGSGPPRNIRHPQISLAKKFEFV